MKKIIKFALVLIVGMLIGLSVYLFDEGNTDVLLYVKSEIIPAAVLALTTSGGIGLVSYPITSRLGAVIDGFLGATERVNESVGECEGAVNTIERLKDSLLTELSKYTDRLEDVEKSLLTVGEEILRGEKTVVAGEEDIKKIMFLGFCNTDELVKKGYAREIAKVIENPSTPEDT